MIKKIYTLSTAKTLSENDKSLFTGLKTCLLIRGSKAKKLLHLHKMFINHYLNLFSQQNHIFRNLQESRSQNHSTLCIFSERTGVQIRLLMEHIRLAIRLADSRIEFSLESRQFPERHILIMYDTLHTIESCLLVDKLIQI